MPEEKPDSGVRQLAVDENQLGQRVDNFLLGRLKGVPKSRIYRIIRKGEVRVNGKRVKPEHKLQAGDVVRVPPLRSSRTEAVAPSAVLLQSLKAAILYEDEHLLILNKPSGLAVHAGTNVKTGLIDALRGLYQNSYLELAHRLDKGTSGCLLVAKNAAVLKSLQQAFRDKQVHKLYHVLVHGNWPAHVTEVNAPLQRLPASGGERRVTIDAAGKQAATRIRLLEKMPGCSLLEASPLTGRTHQIRVHASHVGHPVCGDDKYASPQQRKNLRTAGVNRLCLHAASLEFRHPDDDRLLKVQAAYDDAFAAALEICRSGKLGSRKI